MESIRDTMSRHGRQPFADILVEQGRTIRGTARALDFDPSYVTRVAKGRTAPSDELRRALSKTLGIARSELFTKSALDATYLPQFAGGNPRGFRRGGASDE